MAAPPPPQPRQYAGNLSHHAEPSNTSSIPPIPSRESSLSRGRPLNTTSRATSPRSRTPAATVPKSTSSPDAAIERKPSVSYGHHRQTSIVHGIQHSRNPSFVSTPATSPLSPQVIASVGAGSNALDGSIMTLDEEQELLPTDAQLPNGTSRHGHQGSVHISDRQGGGEATSPAHRRPERVLSGKSKRSHNRSQSRHQHHQQEVRSISDYALHHLFNAFVGQSEQKINQCISLPGKGEHRVELVCGPGVDPNFDQLIVALGHIASQKPKNLIDTLMFWRKAKSEEANNIKQELHHVRIATASSLQPNPALIRRTTEPIPGLNDMTSPNSSPPAVNSAALAAKQHAYALADRKSTISVYLLCRVLMEVYAQTTFENMGKEMEDRLEGIIYTQLKAHGPDVLEEQPLRHANYVIFGQLLGMMSGISFESVASLYIADLEQYQRFLGQKGAADREIEARAVLLVKGMRYLKLDHSTDEAWARSCDFLQSVAKLFTEVHGQPVKYAYCQLLRELLLPIAARANIDFNHPKWKGIIETIRSRLLLLMTKPKHWHEAYPLQAAVLCASPPDIFLSQWLNTALSVQSRLKERASRAIALRSICRLVWTYLYRTTTDSPAPVIRKLDDIIRLIFSPGRKQLLSTDTIIAEPLIQLIRIIGFKYQDYCFRNIIFPLMNADQLSQGGNLRVESLEPERMVIGIRAFLAIMADLEKGERPPFPCTFDSDSHTGFVEMPSLPNSPRPVPQAPLKSSFVKVERLSRPVLLTSFNDIAKESYSKFCRVLGEIAVICDNTFGGQAVLDEKFAVQTPKTPMSDAFSFGRRDDHQTSPDFRQGFYDLLHVAVQALPRCLPTHIPFNTLVNLLCTGTAHVQSNIAVSSAQSLKSIARQSHAQQVTIGFARFIFNFDDRYSTMSDGGLLGPGHIESTLKLYVELLEIWIEEIKTKAKKAAMEVSDDPLAGKRAALLDRTGIINYVDEIESHGLFFLCSPSRRVRAYAIKVLRLVTEFDTALGQDSTRIIRIMEGSPDKVMNINDEKLSLAEKSRLQRGMRKSNIHSTLIELCSGDTTYDSTLWFKIFPNLVRLAFEVCQIVVVMTKDSVCSRLAQLHRTILALADGTRPNPYPGQEPAQNRTVSRLIGTSPEIVIEQWKLYLIFACTTLTTLGSSQGTVVPASQHVRKSSRSSQKSYSKVTTADELFTRVIPFLSVANPAIRDAAVVGLGSINLNLYSTLLESLHAHVVLCSEEAKMRIGGHQRTISSPRRTRRTDFLRTEITHLYKLTSHFLRQPAVYSNDEILTNLVGYTKDLRLFLSDAEVQTEWDYQRLRIHYCGLMEELFEGINRTEDPMRWMPFQSRKAAFALMEDWCGYSPNQGQIRQREDHMRRSILDRDDLTNKITATAAMEIEKRDLRTAALSSMAALCNGPLRIITDSKVIMEFDFPRMLSWIDSIFETVSDKTHAIGRRALKNLITSNKGHPYLLPHMIEKCYSANSPKALESYCEVVTQVLIESEDVLVPFWKVLCAALYTLGSENNILRIKSLRLLRALEEREQKNSKLQDLDISVSDKTIAVYKLAQFETSRRLASNHSELAFHVFSEFSGHFSTLQPDHQRNIVAAMLPWVQTIELQLDPQGGPTIGSYMLLANLFEITVRCGTALHNEIQALWQALATGPHGGNVQLILDFFISLCLEKREQNFVDYAKQIVVYLSSTPAGAKVIEFLLLQVTPKTMFADEKEKRSNMSVPTNHALPYLAVLDSVLPSSNKQYNFSLGMLCLILLVDLVVSPVQLAKDRIPLLLEVVLVLWDHHIPLVQDQAREMLVHLIHELIISKIEDGVSTLDKRSIEDFIDLIRRHDTKIVWQYEDNNGKSEEDNINDRIPEAMCYVAEEVVRIFSVPYPSIKEDWGKTALIWATSCHVRHLACRSLQLFRCILSCLDQSMLADIFARLANTISDDSNSELQIFTMEMLMTLRKIIEYLAPTDLIQYPQLFWITCACLNTVHEREFLECLSMLDKLLDKLNLQDPAVLKILKENKPEKWDGHFEGLTNLVYKGVRSSICLDRSVKLLQRLVTLPSNELVGDDSRLVFTILANLPRFVQSYNIEQGDAEAISASQELAALANDQGLTDLTEVLEHFAAERYRTSQDFLTQIVSEIRNSFFPDLEFRMLTFLISLLTCKLPWVKITTMQVLCVIIPQIDMKKPEIASKGPDLISPLLRLLQTEYCQDALEVLDHVMTIQGTATPLDKHHIRMSMAGPHSSRTFRKEYEKTQSLYGIPEETGWSIPMPAVHSQETRNNVFAVFSTCAAARVLDEAQAATPKIEFRTEEYPFNPYADSRTATMTSDQVPEDGHIGELMLKLDSLDNFFDDDAADDTTLVSRSPSLGHLSNGALDVRENVYDQQTLPILHKSLARNASVASFQSSFNDLKVSRDPGVMTPTAFTAPSSIGPPLLPATAPSRPGLHARSITSPTPSLGAQKTPPGGTSFILDENDEPFSDDDLALSASSRSTTLGSSGIPFHFTATGPPITTIPGPPGIVPSGPIVTPPSLVTAPPASERSFFLESMIKPLTQGTQSRFRSSMRRLTGGSADGRTARAMAAQRSPEVPKVPDQWLQGNYGRDPRSADP